MDEHLIFGLDESALVPIDSQNKLQIHKDVLKSWNKLVQKARDYSIELSAISTYRSFERQKVIWNAKAQGKKQLRDRHGCELSFESLCTDQIIESIMHWSAIPGLSRHHWATELDVIDTHALKKNKHYQVQLIPSEYESDGIFSELGKFLNDSTLLETFQFYRPYEKDLGAIALEPWHLSYYPLAEKIRKKVNIETIEALFTKSYASDIVFIERLREIVPQIYEHYFVKVSSAPIA